MPARWWRVVTLRLELWRRRLSHDDLVHRCIAWRLAQHYVLGNWNHEGRIRPEVSEQREAGVLLHHFHSHRQHVLHQLLHRRTIPEVFWGVEAGDSRLHWRIVKLERDVRYDIDGWSAIYSDKQAQRMADLASETLLHHYWKCIWSKHPNCDRAEHAINGNRVWGLNPNRQRIHGNIKLHLHSNFYRRGRAQDLCLSLGVFQNRLE